MTKDNTVTFTNAKNYINKYNIELVSYMGVLIDISTQIKTSTIILVSEK